jgi:plastocyanin
VSWLAILLTLASFGGNPAPGEVKPRKQCTSAQKHKAAKAKDCKPKKKTKGKSKKAKPKKSPTTKAPPRTDPATGSPAPGAQPEPEAAPSPPVTPGATATPVPTATPAPPGTYSTRTNVDLDEWFVRSSYRTLAAGPIEFNVNNRGEDDHNLAVRGGGREYGKIDVPPGESDMLTLNLWLGSYTLYCSLPDHEEAGMSVNINVR